jgi:hypothetical protein
MANALQRVMVQVEALVLAALWDDALCEEMWIPLAAN